PNGFAISKIIFENDHPIDFIYLEVNESFEKLTGLRNVTGRNASEVIPNFNLSNPKYLEIYGRVALTGQQETFEMCSILKKWFSVSVHSPQKEYFVIVFDEITERKKSEKALKESQKEYNNLFEKMNEGFAIAELIYNDEGEPFDFRWIDVNPSFEKSIGFTRDILLKNTARALFPKVNPKLIKNFGKVMLTGKQLKFDNYNFELKLWTDVIAYKITHKHFAYFTFDITERKKAEELNQKLLENEQQLTEELTSSNEELQSITQELQVKNEELHNQGKELLVVNQRINEVLGSIQDSFYMLDHNWNFIYINQRAANSVNKDPRELIGQNIWTIFPQYMGTIIEKNYREVMKTKESIRFESHGKYTDSWYMLSINPTTEGITVLSTDITERKNYEEALQESEKKYRSIIETANEGVMITDPSAIVTFANSKMAEMLGYPIEELMGIDSLNLIDKTELEKAKQRIQDRKKGIRGEYDLKFIKKNGEVLWTHGSVSPIYDHEGVHTSNLTMYTDITVRKNAEIFNKQLLENEQLLTEELQTSNEELRSTTEELRISNEELRNQGYELLRTNKTLDESEAKYRSIIDNVQDAYIQADKDGKIIMVSPSAAKIYRFNSTNEMIGLSATSLYKNQKDRISLIEGLYKYGKLEDFESEALRKDGTSFVVSLNSQFHHDDKGQIQGTEAFVRDISERKQAENNQEKLSKQLQVALDAANMGWWQYNPITDISTYDNRYKEIFGVLGSERPNDEILKLLHPDDVSRVWAKVEEALDPLNPKEYYAQYRIYRNNEIRWVEAYGITTFEEHGEQKHAVSLVGTVNDITERKKTEKYLQELLESEQQLTEELTTSNEELQSITGKLSKSNIELKRSNEELERFAYVSSHDLQEPLRMVTLYSQLFERRYKDKLDNDADDFIEYIVEGAQRMRLLIDDLLEYSRVKSQAAEFNKVNFDQVLDAVLHNLSVSIVENDVNITHDSLPSVLADKNQMIHVFQNLISNAIKFHGQKPPEINIYAQKEGKKWKFAVKDNGIGIKPEHQKQIFEVFKRLHTKEEYPGTGIGLSITQKIIQHHGGEIWVESEPEKGTTFFFTLPLYQNE
ncbi:PAS domain S-box protein, partial [Methanobacterium sp.]|uniref:PAS domain S-box protein n=2 Tax=Methanobacterium sp. TaxID=2164 RepID=UPI003C75B5C5